MDNIKVSIIVPVYNTSEYLPKCLDALINQTFKNIEIICVNDGSTDNSLEILNEYEKKDNRIKIFNKENDNGYNASAYNLGLKNANSKYIMFCDSDDWYESNMVEEMYKTIEEQKVDIVCCNTNVMNTTEKFWNKFLFPFSEGKQIIDNNSKLLINTFLWNKIFRKNLLDKYNIFFIEDIKVTTDLVFGISYLGICKDIYFFNKKLYNYYVGRPNSVTFLMDRQEKIYAKEIINRNIDILIHIYEFYSKYNLLEKFFYFFENFCKRRIYFGWRQIRISWENEYFEAIKNLIKKTNIVDFHDEKFNDIIDMIMRDDYKSASILLDSIIKNRQKYSYQNKYKPIYSSNSKIGYNFVGDIISYRKNLLKYYRCKILRELSFGKTKKHYKEKCKILKEKIKKVKKFLR